MGIVNKYFIFSVSIYEILRRAGKCILLRKKARSNLDIRIDKYYISQIKRFYSCYTRVSTVFHAVYKQYTGLEDVRFIPDDFFANYIDRYYNSGLMSRVLENKCYYSKMFTKIKQPVILAYRLNNIWYDRHNRVNRVEEIIGSIHNQQIVIKQAHGSGGGRNVFFTNSSCIHDIKVFIDDIHDDIIIQKRIRQHESISRLYPNSVNTIRALSLLNGERVIIYSCFLRCGKGKLQVDNANQGGLICGINMETGKLKKVAFSLIDYHERYEIHPDTGVRFDSVKIPSWENVLELVRLAAPQAPHFRMIAWDIAIDVNGEPVMIEANLNNSAISAHQLTNGPIFKEDTIKILDEVFGKKKFDK